MPNESDQPLSRLELLYTPLGDYLRSVDPAEDAVLAFSEIETMIGRTLPPQAREKAYWWQSIPRQPQSHAWLRADRRAEVDLKKETVTFVWEVFGGSVWSSTAGPNNDRAPVYAETVSFRPADRVFVDESKARGYYVVATASATGSVQASEKALRGLLKPGQRRIHFKSESDSRRREILARLCELDVRVSVWLVRGVADREARPSCLAALTDTALRDGVAHLVIERDASLERADRQLIAAALRAHPAAELRYEHVAPHDKPLLWVSDAVAWCYSNGGDWVRRVEAIVQGRVTRL